MVSVQIESSTIDAAYSLVSASNREYDFAINKDQPVEDEEGTVLEALPLTTFKSVSLLRFADLEPRILLAHKDW